MKPLWSIPDTIAFMVALPLVGTAEAAVGMPKATTPCGKSSIGPDCMYEAKLV